MAVPVTAIDPVTALVVVDLQEGLRQAPTTRPVGEVARAAGALAGAFRERGLPVVLVTADGHAPGRTDRGRRDAAPLPAGFTDVMSELAPADGDLRVTKQRWGAFTGTGLDRLLRSRGVTQVVVVGVATSAGVESTARAAHELGYHVTVATDAVADRDRDAHDNSVGRIFPKLAETGTSAEVIAALPATASPGQGRGAQTG